MFIMFIIIIIYYQYKASLASHGLCFLSSVFSPQCLEINDD